MIGLTDIIVRPHSKTLLKADILIEESVVFGK
jgi:hypothetical protein